TNCGNENACLLLNDKMSFLRRVDLLVNPPLTLDFLTDKIEVTEHLGFPLNDEDFVFPKKQIAATKMPAYF
ncbi:MAG TPA: hypothetical protein PLE33_07700, partial [Candidatus Cloacimonas sp.]|nr:hypothetical protein [Candidatus Cloacimonas sp.]